MSISSVPTGRHISARLYLHRDLSLFRPVWKFEASAEPLKISVVVVSRITVPMEAHRLAFIYRGATDFRGVDGSRWAQRGLGRCPSGFQGQSQLSSETTSSLPRAAHSVSLSAAI